MKASERRLLMLFVALAVLLSGVVGVRLLLGWQKRLERRERDVELADAEANALMAEAPVWHDRGNWLAQSLPVMTTELEANQGLLDVLQNTAHEAGLEIKKTQIEAVEQTDNCRRFGVSLGVKGALPALMRWIHGRLNPGAFYEVPSLRITPDKDDPAKVFAQVRFWRCYAPATAMVSPSPQESSAPNPSE